MKRSIRNWSNVPPELIGLVAECLDSIEDSVSFRGVCRSWRSAVLNYPMCKNVSSKTFTWMVFPQYWHGDDEDEGKALADIHHFFSLSAGKYYKFSLPEVTNRIVSGSPYGWLVLFHKPHMEIFNPLTRIHLPLPLLSTIQGYATSNGMHYFRKVVLVMSTSSSPAKDRFRVFLIFGGDWKVGSGKLAFSRPTDGAWTLVDLPVTFYDDILHLNNEVYIIDRQGLLRRFDVTSPNPIAIEFALPPGIEAEENDEYNFYLVEMLNELIMVIKFKFDDLSYHHMFTSYNTYFFRVFKLHLDTQIWEEMFSLGDYAIFLGQTSYSLLASEYPESKSSIYFTDRSSWFMQPRGDTGIYNLETKSLVALDPGDVTGFGYGAPCWFIPNLC